MMRALVARILVAMLLAAVLPGGGAVAQVADLVDRAQLRVCADPANLPFSSTEGTGFENRIADLLGELLERPVRYTWFPQVNGSVRQTLTAGRCDLLMGAAQGDELVLNTNHYYTSTHVMVVRADSDLADVDHLADPRLRGRRLGVVAGSPVTTHAARLGMMPLAKPYNLMTDRRVENPGQDMLDDLQAGVTDFALMWGPLAGPMARAMPGLKVIPLIREEGTPRLFFRITMGVRAGEDEWKRQLNGLIRRNQARIDAILIEAGVPLVDDYGRTLRAEPG